MKFKITALFLFIIAISILTFTFVSAEVTNSGPCGNYNNGTHCPCIGQAGIYLPNCNSTPVYKDGCLVSYNTTCSSPTCGNGACEDGEADIPGGCGPNADPSCLGPPARAGTCPQDCKNTSECTQQGTSCCKGNLCASSNVDCAANSLPQFAGCDKDCSPKWVCKDTCEKFYTCKDGSKVQYCFSTESGASTNSNTSSPSTKSSITSGGGCSCFSNPESLCPSQSCTSSKCEDGSITSCYTDYNSNCVCSTCPSIIVNPVCGNNVCESGEGLICAIEATNCKAEGDCKPSVGKCYYGCEKDCKDIQGIDAKMNEEFKLQINQYAKVTDFPEQAIRITFRDLLTQSCTSSSIAPSVASASLKEAVASNTQATSSSGTGKGVKASLEDNSNITQLPGSGSISVIKCPAVGPIAQLQIDIPGKNEKKIITLKLQESKQVLDSYISFLGYDFSSRTGKFLVASQGNNTSCPSNCECDSNGRVINCEKKTCEEGTRLCSDGTCQKECEIKNIKDTECNYGCVYNNKCLPVGVRAQGLYCNLNGNMDSQLSSDEACENNFECSTNLCIDNKCVSSSFIQKFLDWFKKLFGS